MKYLGIVLMFAVLVFPAYAAEKGYMLKFDLPQGETLKYSTSYTAKSEVNTFGKVDKFDVKTNFINEQKAVRVEEKGITVESVTLSASGKNNEKDVDLSSFINKKETYFLKGKGVYYKIEDGTVDSNAQVLLLLPDVAVGVGSTWEYSKNLEFNVSIPEFKIFSVKFEYKFEKIEDYKGVKCAVIKIKGKGSQPVSEKVESNLKSTGTAYFSLEKGKIIESSSKTEYFVKMFEINGKEKKEVASFTGIEESVLALVK